MREPRITDLFKEPEVRFNTRKLPPDPPKLGGSALLRFRKNWKEMHRYFRWQMTEDARYWQALEDAIGEDAAALLLGPKDDFRIDSLLEPKTDFEDLL